MPMMILKKNRRWVIYLISCLLFTFSQFYRSSIAVISPNLVEDLNLDTEDLGLISAAFFYAFAAMQIPVGVYLDRVGPRILMTVLSLVAVVGATMFAYGESAGALIVGRLLLGVGMACNLMGPLKLITTWFSPHYFATLSAIFVSVGTAGNIAAATPLVWLTELFGWRTTFLLFALSNLIIAILFYMIAKDHPDDTPVRHPTTVASASPSVAMNGILQLFSRRDYWLISIGTFFRYGIYASVQALWAGPFLIEVMGYSAITISNDYHGSLSGYDRQPTFGHEHRSDYRQPNLRMAIGFDPSFKKIRHYCRIDDDGGHPDHTCCVAYRYGTADSVWIVFWVWIFQ